MFSNFIEVLNEWERLSWALSLRKVWIKIPNWFLISLEKDLNIENNSERFYIKNNH